MWFMAKTKSITPGLLSSSEALYYTSWTASIGLIHAVAAPSGLCRIVLGKVRKQAFVRLIEERHGIKPLRRETPFRNFKQELKQYFSGSLSAFSSPIELRDGTPFEQRVWQTLMTIPYGQTRSYHWVAQQIGHPRAYRAVGGACGRNPLPILIPCHRVIARSGKLGGYTGGIFFKKRLLTLERALKRPS